MTYYFLETLEKFIEYELRTNKGSQTHFDKNRITSMYLELYPTENVKSSMTKEFLIDKILEKTTLLEIYEKYKDNDFGIKPYYWKVKFNLTQSQINKMIDNKFLLFPVFTQYEKVFTNTYANVQYYRAKEYFSTTVEEVEKWKEDNIRGYKNRKNKKDKD